MDWCDMDLKELAKAIVEAEQALHKSVEAASKTPLWNYDTAQALIPGRDAVYIVAETAKEVINGL